MKWFMHLKRSSAKKFHMKLLEEDREILQYVMLILQKAREELGWEAQYTLEGMYHDSGDGRKTILMDMK